MASNGRLPDADLADIPGGRLRKDAAASWLRLRAKIGKETGVWICPTSSRTVYRPYADQVHFWDLYRSGRGALAARPGTSNHGWGLAVDLPTPAMQAAVRKHGPEHGWGIRGDSAGLGSDAPSESWHALYHPDRDRHKDQPASPRSHPYHVLTDDERELRNILVKERRSAKKHGGWDKIDRSHLERATEAKRALALRARAIKTAAGKDGWEKANRRRRYDYIRQLVKG